LSQILEGRGRDKEDQDRSYSSQYSSYCTVEYLGVYILWRNIALITEVEQMSKTENGMYSNQNCTLEGRKLEQCTQHEGIYKAELILM